jgi:molybdate transport system permease protein
MSTTDTDAPPSDRHRPRSDLPFYSALLAIAGVYVLIIVGMLLADVTYTSFSELGAALDSPEIRFSIYLTFVSCTISALLSVLVAVPVGYLLSRYRFPGKSLLDAILDIPIVLPPLVIGLSLLILFNKVHICGQTIEQWFAFLFQWMTWLRADITPGVTYRVPAVILAQFTVAAAFAVRTMRNTFEMSSHRNEQVALTLGCSRSQAFWLVVLPEAWRGVLTAGTLAWARALGEFGPILVFAGATRSRTEVLSTTVFLELSIGNLEAAVAVSMLMVTAAIVVLVVVRAWGTGGEL